jgi:hypothetical protein
MLHAKCNNSPVNQPRHWQGATVEFIALLDAPQLLHAV